MINCVEKEENNISHNTSIDIDLSVMKNDYEFIYNCYYNFRTNQNACTKIC